MTTLASTIEALDMPERPDSDLWGIANTALCWVADTFPEDEVSPDCRLPELALEHEHGTDEPGQTIALAAALTHWEVQCGIVYEDYSCRGSSFVMLGDGDKVISANPTSRSIHNGNQDLVGNALPPAPYEEVLNPVMGQGEFVKYFYLPNQQGKWVVQSLDVVRTRLRTTKAGDYWARIITDAETGTDMLLAIAELHDLREVKSPDYAQRYQDLKHLIPNFKKFLPRLPAQR